MCKFSPRRFLLEVNYTRLMIRSLGGVLFGHFKLCTIDFHVGHLQNPLLTWGRLREDCITLSAGAAVDIAVKQEGRDWGAEQ